MAPTRFRFVFSRFLAIFCLAVAVRALPAQALAGERAQKAEAIKADLQKLSDLERAFFAQNKTFTVDLKALGFTAQSGAQVTMSYASARAWAANATHPAIDPYVCFAIVSSPTGNADVDKPFCTDSRRGTAPTAIAKAGPAETASAKGQKAPAKQDALKGAPAPQKAAPVAQAPAKTEAPKTVAPAPQKVAPAPTTPPKAVAAPAKTDVQKAASLPVTKTEPTKTAIPAPKKADATVAQAPVRKIQTPPLARRNEPRVRGGRGIPTPVMAAQGDVAADARAQTRPASAVRGAAAPEAVSSVAFAERLSAIAAGAREALGAKPPELVRDPYESSAEYAARRAQALAIYERREDDFFAKNSRTFVVQISGKDAKYDPDREILDLALENVTLPVARELGAAQLAVACYTRPVFWCSPDTGMTYEATGLWHVPRAKARELDVLRAPITVQARFVVGRREDQHGAALTLVGLELTARGQVLAKWDAAAETR